MAQSGHFLSPLDVHGSARLELLPSYAQKKPSTLHDTTLISAFKAINTPQTQHTPESDFDIFNSNKLRFLGSTSQFSKHYTEVSVSSFDKVLGITQQQAVLAP